MNTNRKNTIRRLIAKSPPYIPVILFVGAVIGAIMTFFQSDLRGVANCGSWKAPICVEKKLKGKVKGNVKKDSTLT